MTFSQVFILLFSFVLVVISVWAYLDTAKTNKTWPFNRLIKNEKKGSESLSLGDIKAVKTHREMAEERAREEIAKICQLMNDLAYKNPNFDTQTIILGRISELIKDLSFGYGEVPEQHKKQIKSQVPLRIYKLIFEGQIEKNKAR